MLTPSSRVAVPRRLATSLALLAVALAVALGLVLRLADPLSSTVIPAEDPYNHMALVREHLRTGELHALNDGETVYPPGLHAFVAAAWAYSGADLYGIVRFVPVAFGVLGIVGVALLLWRHAGPAAAVVGALALAVAPELIFRTTMMSPTALDFALLPFLFHAMLRTLAGRIAWAGVAAPLAVFLALAHPWLLAILCASAACMLVSLIVLPWPAARGAPVWPRGAAAVVAVLGLGLAVAALLPGFAGTLGLPTPGDPVAVAAGIALVAAFPLAVLAWGRRRGWRITTWSGFAQPPVVVRAAISVAIAIAVSATFAIARQQGFPPLVDLPAMFGWPILVLAVAALVAMPFISSPVANLAACLFAVTLPFTVFNPLASDFLSHRTAAFLGLALVLLVGVAAGALARATTAMLGTRQASTASAKRAPSNATTPAVTTAAIPSTALAASTARPSPAVAPRSVARPLLLAALPTLLVVALVGGSVYAGTPDAYEGGWYRLYHPCELDALRDVAALADANPDAIVMTGDWQAKLVLAALTEDASRVWYSGEFFTSTDARAHHMENFERAGQPVLVVLDRHLRVETPDADTGFVDSPPWQPAGSWCANMGVATPRLTAYATPDLVGAA